MLALRFALAAYVTIHTPFDLLLFGATTSRLWRGNLLSHCFLNQDVSAARLAASTLETLAVSDMQSLKVSGAVLHVCQHCYSSIA